MKTSIFVQSLFGLTLATTSLASRWPVYRDDGIRGVKIIADGPLVQCEEAVLSWSDDRIPKKKAYDFNVRATVDWTEIDSTGQSRTLTHGSRFSTPSFKLDWTVDYPAGAIVRFEFDGYATNGDYIQGESANMTIQESDDVECIPESHYPIKVTVAQPEATECEVTRISWTGGAKPYGVHINPTNLYDVSDDFYENRIFKTAGKDEWYIDWVADYPVGTTLNIRVWGADSFWENWGQPQQSITVTKPSCTNKCIPREHRYGYRRWFQHPAAIAGFVVGGLLVLAGLSYGGWKGYLYWVKRREGAVRLP